MEDLQILEIKENINTNIESSSIVKAQQKRQKNINNRNIEKDEQIKLLIDNIINKDLERIEEKRIKLYKKLSKIL
jgi:hypothetical protein